MNMSKKVAVLVSLAAAAAAGFIAGTACALSVIDKLSDFDGDDDFDESNDFEDCACGGGRGCGRACGEGGDAE